MSQQNWPMRALEMALTWPFSLASLNKERQGNPATRTLQELFQLSSIDRCVSPEHKMAQAPIGFLAQHFAAFWIWPAAHNGSLKIGVQNWQRAGATTAGRSRYKREIFSYWHTFTSLSTYYISLARDDVVHFQSMTYQKSLQLFLLGSRVNSNNITTIVQRISLRFWRWIGRRCLEGFEAPLFTCVQCGFSQRGVLRPSG